MQAPSIRLVAAAVCVAALAACADAPTSAPEGKLINLSTEAGTVRLPGTYEPAAEPDADASNLFIPRYCEPGVYSQYCPEMVIGAAVYNMNNTSGGSTARLYAHLDLTSNVNSSELIVQFKQSAGCGSTPGLFHTEHLYGGSIASAGGPYALVAQIDETFTGGTSKWQVAALGKATSQYGSQADDSAWDEECF